MNPSPALLSLVQKWRMSYASTGDRDYDRGWWDSCRERANELEEHLPALAVLVEQHQKMREVVLKFSYHGIGCRAGGYFEDNDPEKPECICGLSALRAALDTKARGDVI